MKTISAIEAACRKSCSVSTIYCWLHQGKIDGVKVEGRWQIRCNSKLTAIRKWRKAKPRQPQKASFSNTEKEKLQQQIQGLQEELRRCDENWREKYQKEQELRQQSEQKLKKTQLALDDTKHMLNAFGHNHHSMDVCCGFLLDRDKENKDVIQKLLEVNEGLAQAMENFRLENVRMQKIIDSHGRALPEPKLPQ